MAVPNGAAAAAPGLQDPEPGPALPAAPDAGEPAAAIALRTGNTQNRGIDAGLAKSAPDASSIDADNYRDFRRRLDIFERTCQRRGPDAVTEGAYLIMNMLQADAWQVTESVNLDDLETPRAFAVIRQELDLLYRYEPEVEMPNRCEDFFNQFCCLKDETLNSYVARHAVAAVARRRLAEAGVPLPEKLAGWHLMSRLAMPRWQEPTLRSHYCRNELTVRNFTEALKNMFGGDSKASFRDVKRLEKSLSGRTGRGVEDGFALDDHDYYGYEDYYEDYAEDWGEDDEWAEDGYYEIDEEPEHYEPDDAAPPELEKAADKCEEALAAYRESRQKTRELANARGFYPVAALAGGRGLPAAAPPASSPAPRGSSKGESRGRGSSAAARGFAARGSSGAKGKGKGKSAAGRQPLRSKPTHTDGSPKTSSSGSTQQHGPRFKRRRPEEAANIVHDSDAQGEQEETVDDIYDADGEDALTTEAGKGITDSGATRPVMGEETWQRWLDATRDKGIALHAKYEPCNRQFRFGNKEVLVSKRTVTFTAKPFGANKELTVNLVPGSTPMLVARTCLEDWGMILDFRKGTASLKDDPAGGWKPLERDDRGHFILDLLGLNTSEADALVGDSIREVSDADGDPANSNNGDYVKDSDDIQSGERVDNDDDVDYLITDYSKALLDECKLVSGRLLNQMRASWDAHVAHMRDTLRYRKVVWELFVDRGDLGLKILGDESVQVLQFSIQNGWDFRKRAIRREIIDKCLHDEPDEIFMSPVCSLWSTLQELNVAQHGQAYVDKLRSVQEMHHECFLKLCRHLYNIQQAAGRHAHIEQPLHAGSWKTPAFTGMTGYDAVLDQCRLGLELRDKSGALLGRGKKPTRIRTTKKSLALGISLKCRCQENGIQHISLEGNKNIKGTQNYPRPMVDLLAELIMEQEMDAPVYVTEDFYTFEELEHLEYNELYQKLLDKFPLEVVKKTQRLHEHFGHPAPTALAAALQQAGCDEHIVKRARCFTCEDCLKMQRPKEVRIAALPRAGDFIQIVDMDVFHVMWRGRRRLALTIMDEHSRLERDIDIDGKTAQNEIKALETQWIPWAGTPHTLRTDMSGSHMSEEFATWVSERGIRLRLIPADSHHQLGMLERNHQGCTMTSIRKTDSGKRYA